MVCEVTKDNAFAVVGQAVSSFEDGKTYTVEIKEKKEKRSREANAYAWVLLDKLAEKLGLKVDLCHDCHNEPPNGVHFNAENNNQLKAKGQKAAMLAYHWTIEDFIKEIGRNYL